MSKNTAKFTLVYWKDSGWIVGALKEVPGIISQGKTMDDLVENILDAYKEMKKSSEDFFTIKKTKQKKLEIAI